MYIQHVRCACSKTFLAIAVAILHKSCSLAFSPFATHFNYSVKRATPLSYHRVTVTVLFATKGFGGKSGTGGGFGSKSTSTAKKKKKPSRQEIQSKLEKVYGVTSPQEIALATQQKVEDAIKALPPHIQMATQLYEQLSKWSTYYSRLSLLQQASVPQADLDGAARAQAEFDRLCSEHGFTEIELHNVFQKITWDASADAKAARAITADMPSEIEQRVSQAVKIIAEAVSGEGRCLDVGCGFGVLVPYLMKAGLRRDQIIGIDLSSEMIRNAREQHPDISFIAADFINEYHDDHGFEGVLFCSALHDMPDPILAIQKAASLLKPAGTLVIVHPQGATHVLKQASANPILVKRGLPDAVELRKIDEKLQLILEPASAGSHAEANQGYLAVLKKI